MSAAAMKLAAMGAGDRPSRDVKFIVRGRPLGAASEPGSRGRQSRDREPVDELADLAGEPALGGGVVPTADGLDDDPADRAHLVLAEATGRRRRGPQAD